MTESWSTSVRRFLKYCVTGVLNTGVSYVVFSFLVFLGVGSAAALAAGYVCGMATSYVLNARWTFQTSAKHTWQLVKFIGINVGVLIFSEGCLRLISHHVIASPYLAQALNLIPTTLVGFYVNRKYVFTKRTADDVSPSDWRRVVRYAFIALAMVVAQRVIVAAGEIHGASHTKYAWTWYRVFVIDMIHWDAGWYLEIARHGYVRLTETAFWPLYPWFIRWFHEGTGIGYDVSAIVLSAISFFLAIWFFLLWIDESLGAKAAISGGLLFVFYPTSFYFDAAYTESLFTLFAILAVYTSRRGHLFWANVWTALATLTRNTGGLLGFILFFDYVQKKQIGWKFWTRTWWRKLSWRAVYFLIPAATLVVYCYRLKRQFGMWTPFLYAEHHHWHRHYLAPWICIERTVQFLIHPKTTIMSQEYIQFEVAAFVAVVVLVGFTLGYMLWRRQAAYIGWFLYVLSVGFITSSEPSVNIPDYLVSLPRYVLMLFPAFGIVGKVLRSVTLCAFIALLFAVVLFWKSGVFYRGIWIA